MSVRLMTLVFQAEIGDLEYTTKAGKTQTAKASTAKWVLTCYADHANDEGEGTYPGYDRLLAKTELSRPGLANTIRALRQNGYLIFEGKSKYGTKSYSVNAALLQSKVKPLYLSKSSDFTSESKATLPKPSVEPSVKPSIKDSAPNGAPAPKAAEQQPEQKAQPSPLKLSEQIFSDITGIPLPARNTVREKKSAGVLWWNPLRAMLKLCDEDARAFEGIARQVIAGMEKDRLTIASPKSIQSNFVDVARKAARTPAPPSEDELEARRAMVRAAKARQNGIGVTP